MTQTETLAAARAITRGTTCFVMPVGDRFKVCRRVEGRVINLGYRTQPASLLAYVRKLAAH
jgi:hypothetical protein